MLLLYTFTIPCIHIVIQIHNLVNTICWIDKECVTVCSSEPCQHDASCRMVSDGYTCDCKGDVLMLYQLSEVNLMFIV